MGKFFISEKPVFFRAKNATVSTLRSGTDYCWLYCDDIVDVLATEETDFFDILGHLKEYKSI